MRLQAEQVLDLTDAQQRQIGQVRIQRLEDELLYGKFIPGPDFAQVAHLIRKSQEAADSQALAVIDHIDTAIAALGLRLRLPGSSQFSPEIYDVQIWDNGEMSCRVRAQNLFTQEELKRIPEEKDCVPLDQFLGELEQIVPES